MHEKIIKNLIGSYFFITGFEKGMTVKMYFTVLNKWFVYLAPEWPPFQKNTITATGPHATENWR